MGTVRVPQVSGEFSYAHKTLTKKQISDAFASINKATIQREFIFLFFYLFLSETCTIKLAHVFIYLVKMVIV